MVDQESAQIDRVVISSKIGWGCHISIRSAPKQKAGTIVLRALVDRCERAGPPVTSAFAPIAVIVVDPTLRD